MEIINHVVYLHYLTYWHYDGGGAKTKTKTGTQDETNTKMCSLGDPVTGKNSVALLRIIS